ncbi:hypothetical protein SAMN04488072_110110 [Lentibacillus halodurans]|uniref:Uncharacterized protein n=1 Tax=Lentibacillus halodurans TaxID=237679 RepID=A0A1I0ZED1_9BACI|nr:hypothetical protein SAMN04488072_110110 [Lentibacillus halodurans]
MVIFETENNARKLRGRRGYIIRINLDHHFSRNFKSRDDSILLFLLKKYTVKVLNAAHIL